MTYIYIHIYISYRVDFCECLPAGCHFYFTHFYFTCNVTRADEMCCNTGMCCNTETIGTERMAKTYTLQHAATHCNTLQQAEQLAHRGWRRLIGCLKLSHTHTFLAKEPLITELLCGKSRVGVWGCVCVCVCDSAIRGSGSHGYAYKHTHAHIYTHINMHAHTYTHTHAHTHACTPTHTHTHTHTHPYTHMHIHIHTHKHTHTHTHTHLCTTK